MDIRCFAQSCGKKTATTHIKTIVNGKLTQYHLLRGLRKNERGTAISFKTGVSASAICWAAYWEQPYRKKRFCGVRNAEPVLKKSLKRAKLAAHIATRFSAGSWRLSFNEFTVPHSTKERFRRICSSNCRFK